MLRYILKRLFGMVPVLFLVLTATFLLMRLAPGGPFDSDRRLPPEIKKQVEDSYHLNDPLLSQYARYLTQLAHGDLGPSFRYGGRSVNDLILTSAPVSFELGLVALVYALLLGVTVGLIAASKPGGKRDRITMMASLLGVCMPSFVLGPLFIWVFATKLGWLHASGWRHPGDILMPAVALGTIYAAYIARLTRSGVLELSRQDFIRTARAKGLSESLILVRHSLKGALLPVLSFLGPAAAGLLTGSFVIESLFDVPGIGRFFVQSAVNRDYTLLLGMVLLFAVVLLMMNVVVDVCYTLIDPRLRLKG